MPYNNNCTVFHSKKCVVIWHPTYVHLVHVWLNRSMHLWLAHLHVVFQIEEKTQQMHTQQHISKSPVTSLYT